MTLFKSSYHLFRHPYKKIKYSQKDLKISCLATTKYLEELTKEGYLEKILVDLLTSNPIYNVFKGAELKTIFSNALEKYTLNENRVLRYANRRGKKEEFSSFINSEIKFKLSANIRNIPDL